MPLDPTGRYKGNNFDPNYAAKKKAKLEQRNGKGDYDHRPRDNGYTARHERDGRGWEGPVSLDYGGDGPRQYSNNYTPQRDSSWVRPGDRPLSPKGYRYSNPYSTPRQEIPQRQYPPTSASNAYSRPAERVKTPPLTASQSDTREMDATLKDLSNLVGIEAPGHLSLNGNSRSGAPLEAASGPGGELSSLEKLKLFKAQVEASRSLRSADASSTAVTRVAESFLQRESPSQVNAAEEGEVAESNAAFSKAQALKAKLQASKQKKSAPPAIPAPESTAAMKTPKVQSQKTLAHDRNTSEVTRTSNASALGSTADVSVQRPNYASKESNPSQRAVPQQAGRGNQQTLSYADAARDYSRRRSASPRARTASPARLTSRPREQVGASNSSTPVDRYADKPSEYTGPRSRKNQSTRYERLPSGREENATGGAHTVAPPATPLPVSSTSINLVVKTLEVIKAQVEQLEVLIQPMLNARDQAESTQTASVRGLHQRDMKDAPLPPASVHYTQDRPPYEFRPSFDSYERNTQSYYHKRKMSNEDDGEGGYHRSTPTRGGFKRGRGSGRGGKSFNHRDTRDTRD